jgi:hypothetical protein
LSRIRSAPSLAMTTIWPSVMRPSVMRLQRHEHCVTVTWHRSRAEVIRVAERQATAGVNIQILPGKTYMAGATCSGWANSRCESLHETECLLSTDHELILRGVLILRAVLGQYKAYSRTDSFYWSAIKRRSDS